MDTDEFADQFTVEARRWSQTDHGGWDVSVDGHTIAFVSTPAKSNGVAHSCPLCGVVVEDWQRTAQRVALAPVNHVAHVRFHIRIGDLPPAS